MLLKMDMCVFGFLLRFLRRGFDRIEIEVEREEPLFLVLKMVNFSSVYLDFYIGRSSDSLGF